MFDLTGLPALDLAIGLAFIFFLLSTLAATIQEFIAAVLGLRARTLEQGLRSLLEDPERGWSYVDKFYDHPLIRSMYRTPPPESVKSAKQALEAATRGGPQDDEPRGARRELDPQEAVAARIGRNAVTRAEGRTERAVRFFKRTKGPSYLSPRAFALVVLDNFAAESGHPTVFDRGMDALESLPPGLRTRLGPLIEGAQTDVEKLRTGLEALYDDTMARVSGWYKRKTQIILVVIGVVVVLATNANTLTMGQRMWKDDTVRSAVVAQAQADASGQAAGRAQALNKAANDVDKVDKVGIPLGWRGVAVPHGAGAIVAAIGGWLLTVLAISLGAPFWFDSLSRLSRLRSSGKPETPLPASGSGKATERILTAPQVPTVVVQENSGPAPVRRSRELSMDDAAALLERFKPSLRYDSNESYFTDSALEMTDARGTVLRTASGDVIAAASPGHSLWSQLVPAKENYPGTKVKAAKGDSLGIGDHDYRRVYRELRASHPGYRNVVYGRRVEGESVWLQYWFFSFYNDLRFGNVGLGLHEGDWEGIQLRLDGREPDLAVYAQHTYGEAREWRHVEKEGDRPVVYVARGSHASYFDDGAPVTHWHLTEHFIDRADGSQRPQGDVRLEVLREPDPDWVRWPGTWGATRPPDAGPKPYREISDSSPIGPGMNRRWTQPETLLDAAIAAGRAPGIPRRAPPTPATPSLAVTAGIEDGRLALRYQSAPADEASRPTTVLVTVNSPDDHYPPTTYPLNVDAAAGTLVVPHTVEPGHTYEVRASAEAAHGGLSPAQHVRVAAPA